MAGFIVWLIGRLGRYAVLLPLCVIALVAYGWLVSFDYHPYAAVAASFIVVPAAMAGAALALGIVLTPSARLPKHRVTRDEAPRLWAFWDELDPAPARRRVLAIDEKLNASMGERRGPLGLGQTEILTIGLPLLMVCDEAATKAVVAHEVGHARLAHASGLANICDFVGSFDLLFDYADPSGTVIGGLVDWILSGAMLRLRRQMNVVSRRHEFEADLFAGGLKPDQARGLVLLKAAERSLDEFVYRPLESELLGATSPPKPPMERIVDNLPEIHSRGVTATARLDSPPRSAEQIAEEALYGSTHPSFEDSMRNLGFQTLPEITAVAAPASATLLPARTFDRLKTTFDERWLRYARDVTGGEN